MQRLAASLCCATALGALTGGLLGCQDVLPSNPYDPKAPPIAQARGEIRGAIAISGTASHQVLQTMLDEIEVLLASGAGRELARLSCGSAPGGGASITCAIEERGGRFSFAELPAGEYRVAIEGMDPGYTAPAIPRIELLPGEIEDLGVLRFTQIPIEPVDPTVPWTGRVTGIASLSAGQGGPRRMTLLRRGGSGLEAHAVALTDSQGAFTFDEVPPGVYGLSAELEQHTPDYRAGFTLQGAEVSVEQNTQAFTGSEGLLLHPVTAVLIPALQQTFGQYYTREDAVPLQVLQFGQMNQMRLSTDPGFASGTQVWVEYAASADVPLPSREGAIDVHAQFRNTRVDGFVFESSVYSARVIRDVSAPTVEGLRVRGRAATEDGRIWLPTEGETLGLEIDGADAVSAVYEVAVYHDAQNTAGDPATLVYDLVNSPGGLVRMAREQTLTAGEGEKVVVVYLRDRAGNTSEARSVSLWVDATPPVVDLLVLNTGATVTGSRTVTLALRATDSNRVVGMRFWEEGQPEPAGFSAYQEVTTLQLQPLDYGNTQRQVNARVIDQAGNVSTTSAATITFDDRGSISGLLRVDDAADGSPGDVSGISALVNGQSYPFAATAGTNPGDPWQFTVRNVPSGANRLLVLQKAGYADASPASLFSVNPGLATDVGALDLLLARGSIEGWVAIEGLSDASNAIARIDSTGQFALTDSDGYFRLEDVPARLGYSVTLSYDSVHASDVVTGINVPARGTARISQQNQPVVLRLLAGSFHIGEGSYASSSHVHLIMNYDNAVEYRASTNRGDLQNDLIGWSAFSSAVGSSDGYGFDLPPQDGLYAVYVQFRDAVPNASEIYSDVVTLDRVAPTGVALQINGGATHTSTLSVTLTPSGVDDNPIPQLQLCHRDTTDAGALLETDWEGPRSWNGQPFGVSLPGALDFRTARVWLRLLDAAGNPSLPALASIVLDPEMPQGTSIAIEGGATVTNSFLVTLTLTAVDDTAIEMLIADEAVPATGTWRTFAASTSWVLPPATQGDKKVCVAFRDAALNRTPETCASIRYDSVKPPTPVMTTTAGASTRLTAIDLNFANVTSDVESIEVAGNAAFSGSQVVPAQAQVPFTLSSGDGVKLVYARYIDGAGNRSEAAVLSILLDTEAPLAPTLSVKQGLLTNSRVIDLQLGALGASEVLIARSANCSTGAAGPDAGGFDSGGAVDEGWRPYSASVPWLLLDSDSPQDVSVRYRDLANNQTGCLSARITLDHAAPTTGTPAVTLSNLRLELDAAGTAVQRVLARIDLSATGASAMRVSNYQNDSTAPWLPYQASLTDWEMIPTDGLKVVYVVFKDAADNATAESSASIFIDTTGDITGTLTVEGASDYSGVEFFLDGTPRTPLLTGSQFTLEGVLATEYGALEILKTDYDAVAVRNVRVPPGGAANVGALSLRQSRGSVEGYVELAAASSHENVLVELLNTGYTARTNSAGYFYIGDVLVGTYDLKASRDGYSPQFRTSLFVSSGLTTSVSTASDPISMPVASGDYKINGGASYTSSTHVHLNLSYTDAIAFRVSEDPDFDGSTDFPVDYTGAGDYDFDLGPAPTPPQGEHTVYVQFDTPGGPSARLQSSIVLDTVPPTAGTVLLAGGATAIKVLNVSAALSASDANGIARIATSTNGTTFAPPVTYQSPYTYGFTGGEGQKCLHVQFIDPAGNRSALPAASDCIEYDITGPTGLVEIVDQNGVPYPGNVTRSRGVYLRITTSDPDGQMKISNKATLTDAVWQPYDATLQPWNLNAGDGDRTVYIALRDLAGTEVKGVAGFDATIRVDSTPPAAPVFTIGEGTATSSTTVHLNLANWTTGDTVLFESNQALGSTQSKAAAGALTFTLPDVEGLHLLGVRYRDAAGNESATSSASIVLDHHEPTLLRFAVEGNGYTKDSTVTLIVEADGASWMRFSNSGDFSSATWEPYSTRRLLWGLDTTVQATKFIWVQLRDAALNETDGTDLTQVEYDTVAPSATLVLAGGVSPVTTQTISVALQGAPADTAWMAVSSAGAPACASVAYSAFAAEFSHTLARANDTNTVYVCLKDLADNWLRLDADIVHDATAPLISAITVPTTSRDPDGAVTVQVTLSNGESSRVAVTLSSAHASATTLDIDPAVSRTGSAEIDLLPVASAAADADVLLEIRATDGAGNAYSTSRVVRVDRQAPTGAILVDGGATYSTSPSGQVTLTLSAADNFSGVARMRFSNDGSTWDAWQDFAGTYGPWTLATPSLQNDVVKYVYVQLEDQLGNQSSALGIWDDVHLDNVAPSPGILQIDGDAGTTNSRRVDLTFSATAASEMKLSPGGACVGGGWETYVEATVAAPYPWVLDGEGSAVYASARFRDAAGNESGCISDFIEVDQTSPELPSIVIDSGATYNNSASHGLSVKLGATGATSYRLAETAEGVESAGWVSPVPATAFTHTLSAANQGDGEKTLFAQFRDSAGNLSVVVSDGIVHDATPPVVGYVLVDNGAPYSRSDSGQVSLYFGGSDETSGVAAVQVSNDGSTWSTAQTFTGYIASWTLAAPVSPVDGEERTVRLRLIDRAGNTNAAQADGNDTDEIVLDNVEPAGSLLVNGAALYASSQAVVVEVSTDDDVELVALANDTAPACATAAYSGRQDAYAWTLSAGDTPAPQPPKSVYACFRDRAGNSSSAAVDTIRLDTQAPSFFTVTQYPLGTASAITSDADGGIELVITLDVVDQATVSVLASVVGSSASASGALAQGVTVTTLHLDAAPALGAAADGSYVVDVTATDAAGNSYAETRVVLVDRQAPTLSALTCPSCRSCEGRQFIEGIDVLLEPQGFDDTSGLERFELRNAANDLVDTAGLGEPLTFALPATEGVVQTYTARAIDRAGLASDPVDIDLVHDALPPTLSVAINNGDDFTATSSVEVGLAMADGNLAAFPECYELRHAWGTAPTGTWGPYVGAFPTTVNSPTSDGSKTLYVQVRDPAGRTVSDDDAITLDTTAPAVTIDVQSTGGGDDYTITPIVDVRLTFSNDTVGYRLVPSFDDCATLPVAMFTPPLPDTTSLVLEDYDLTGVPGLLPPFDTPEGDPVTLKACFRDGADNRAGDSDTITLDRRPLIGAVVIDGDAAYTTDTGVTLTFAVDASDTDLVHVCNGLDAIRCEDGLGPCDVSRSFVDSYTSTRSWTLAASDGTKHVLACLQDDAGHRSPIGDDIDLDTSAPALAGLAIRGRVGFRCCFQGEFCSGFADCSESTAKSRLPVAALEFGFASTSVHTGVEVAIANGVQECSALAGWKLFAPTGGCQDTVLGGAGYDCQRVEQWALSEAEGEVTVTVCARDPAGLMTQLTDTIEVDRTPPSEASITDASAEDRVVSLSWEGSASSDLAGYRVKWFQAGYPLQWAQQVDPATTDPNHLPATTESHVVAPPLGPFSNCAPVELRVMGFDDAGNWSFSAPVSVTPSFQSPGAVQVVGQARELQVSWDAVPDAARYRVYVASASDVQATAQGYFEVAGGVTQLAIRDGAPLTAPTANVQLADSTTYHVGVSALDGVSFQPDCYSAISTSASDQTRSLSVSHVWAGSVHQGEFGRRLVAADLDHDGYTDLIVSSPATPDVYQEGNGYVQKANAGIVEVYSGRTRSRMFMANGARPEEYAGAGLAVLGDLDRDGWKEFAVGRPGWPWSDLTKSSAKQGRVDIYSGRTGFQHKYVLGEWNDGDMFGAAIATAGDFVDASDNPGIDGIPEFAVGAPGYNGGAGRVYFFNGATQRELSAYRRDGAAGQRYGAILANAVARSDGGFMMAAGSPALGAFNGVVHVFKPEDGAIILSVNGTAIFRIGGAVALSEPFGSTKHNLVAVAGPDAGSGGRVRVYAYDGATVVGPEVINSPFASTLKFGSALAFAQVLRQGDAPDLAIAVSDDAVSGVRGRLALYQVDATPTSRLALAFRPEAPGALFGTSLAVGRFNNTGVDEIVAGAPLYSVGYFQGGGAFLFSHSLLQVAPAAAAAVRNAEILFTPMGGTGPYSIDFATGGNQSFAATPDSSGLYVAGPVDAVLDSLVFQDSKARQLTVQVPVVEPAGAKGSVVVSPAPCALDEDCALGAAIAIIHDYNGDQKRDIAVSAPFKASSGGLAGSGEVYIYSGTGGFPNLQLLATIPNPIPEAGANFGMAIEVLGDLNADGVAEIAISAPRANVVPFTDCGRVFVFSGKDLTRLGYLDVTGSANDQQIGHTLAYLGNHNDLAGLDLAVGNPTYAADSGVVCVANLSTSGVTPWPSGFCSLPDPARAFDRVLGAAGDRLGAGVDGGDVSGDGVPDLIIGAPGSDVGARADAGRVLVYLGSRYGNIQGQVGLDYYGASTGALLGAAVITAGDFDDDGSREILVGAPGDSSRGFTFGGSVHLLSTRTGTSLASVSGTENYAYFGSSVAVADFNHDGYADWIVGAPGSAVDFYGDDGDIYLLDGATGTGQNVHSGDPGKSQLLGYNLAAGADIDGDGFEEFVAGIPGRRYWNGASFTDQPGGAKLFFTCSPYNRGGVCPP